PWGLGPLGAAAVVDRKNDLPNFDFFALLDQDIFDSAGYRRWNFDDCFVGFKLHDRLALGDTGAGRYHEAHQVSLVDVFAKFGELEFSQRGLQILFSPQSHGGHEEFNSSSLISTLCLCDKPVLAYRRVRLLWIDSQLFDCLVDDFGFDLF